MFFFLGYTIVFFITEVSNNDNNTFGQPSTHKKMIKRIATDSQQHLNRNQFQRVFGAFGSCEKVKHIAKYTHIFQLKQVRRSGVG